MASKRAEMADIINADMENRNIPKKSHQTTPEGANSDPLVLFSIRLPQRQKELLQAHFKQELGLDLSPGIRMIITQYMREHRL